ncbi:DUF5133 domain-containing protein [Streptomyces broussonetiae]|uniref:DUF5133 domain-containing protein n=1 Tax=Streptomyces broussonetiae TaxID=2686304 RepID=A0ABV5EGC5_9ACTN
MLLPARSEVARQLRQYRAWERVMLAAPTDRTVRATFEDAGYTLCVLMGRRCAREAADAAERYLRGTAVTCSDEQYARTRAGVAVRAGVAARRGPPPVRCSPAGRQ